MLLLESKKPVISEEVKYIEISQILNRHENVGRGETNPAKVKEIAETMTPVGENQEYGCSSLRKIQKTPIIVFEADKGCYFLGDGAHRLGALERLGHTQILAHVVRDFSKDLHPEIDTIAFPKLVRYNKRSLID